MEEVIKFITMVIFTSSVQHAAVNNGQVRIQRNGHSTGPWTVKITLTHFHFYFKFDFQSWPPNGPFILRKEPPSTKGQSSLQTVLETLPLKGISSRFVATTWVLVKKYTGFVSIVISNVLL